jgi:hypothetical protein
MPLKKVYDFGTLEHEHQYICWYAFTTEMTPEQRRLDELAEVVINNRTAFMKSREELDHRTKERNAENERELEKKHEKLLQQGRDIFKRQEEQNKILEATILKEKQEKERKKKEKEAEERVRNAKAIQEKRRSDAEKIVVENNQRAREKEDRKRQKQLERSPEYQRNAMAYRARARRTPIETMGDRFTKERVAQSKSLKPLQPVRPHTRFTLDTKFCGECGKMIYH